MALFFEPAQVAISQAHIDTRVPAQGSSRVLLMTLEHLIGICRPLKLAGLEGFQDFGRFLI